MHYNTPHYYQAGHLSLPNGVKVNVLESSDENWWLVALDGDVTNTLKGYFPRLYLQPIIEKGFVFTTLKFIIFRTN